MRPSGVSSLAPLIFQLGVSIFSLQLISVLPKLAGAHDPLSLNQREQPNVPIVETTVTVPSSSDDSTGIDASNFTGVHNVRRDGKILLKVMPLGASITKGEESSTKNGYRRWIRKQLRWKGWPVNMVGSQDDGGNGFPDTQHEGHPGAVIDQVHGYWTNAYKNIQPNLVLLNVGNNDCHQNKEEGAEKRFGNLVQAIFDDMPNVVVIISTLVPSVEIAKCTQRVSAKYRELAANYPAGKIEIADFDKAIDPDTMLNEPNKYHPNDKGYKVMASVWWDAISKVADNIEAPEGNLDEGPDDLPIEDPKLPPYSSLKSRSVTVAQPFQA